MSHSLVFAGLIAVGLALGHSLLGERLIFKRLAEIAPSITANPLLSHRHWAALRSTWHLASLLGLGFAAMLFSMAFLDTDGNFKSWLLPVISMTFLISAVYWIVGTRGKHLGWIPMLLIALLVWWA